MEMLVELIDTFVADDAAAAFENVDVDWVLADEERVSFVAGMKSWLRGGLCLPEKQLVVDQKKLWSQCFHNTFATLLNSCTV